MTFKPPKCPECEKPLLKVDESFYEIYEFNPYTGNYDNKPYSNVMDITCPKCGYKYLDDVFPDGVCNFVLDFPEEVTLDECSAWFNKETNEVLCEVFSEDDWRDNSVNALKKVKERGGKPHAQIYTQVDCDTAPDFRTYSRGIRYVNRTGVYMVLWRGYKHDH